MNDGRKRKPQKHQNKAAFKVMFDPMAEQTHKKVSFRGYSLSYPLDSAKDARSN